MDTWLIYFLMNDIFSSFFAPCLQLGTFMKVVQLNRVLLNLTGGMESCVIFRRIAFHAFHQSAVSFLYNYQFISWLFAADVQCDIVQQHRKWLLRQPLYVTEGIEESVYTVLCEIWQTYKYNPLGVEFFESHFRQTYFLMQSVYTWNKASFKRVLLAYWMLTSRTNVHRMAQQLQSHS